MKFKLFGIAVFSLFLFGCTSPTQTFSEDCARIKYERAKKLIHEYSGVGNHYELATELSNEILSNNPESPYSYLILAELKSRQYKDYKIGSPEAILSLIDKVVSLDGKIAGAYVISAKMANINGDAMVARNNLNYALSIEPKNPEATYELAILEQNLGNFDKSEEFFRRTISLYSSAERKSNIYYWLGKMYLKMYPENIEKADQAMAKMVELSPDAPWKVVNYSMFLNKKTKRYDDSIKYARQSLTQMNFGMGRKALGMGLYAKWAESFIISDVSSTYKTSEMTKLGKIENETGITPIFAESFAKKYMPLSSIPEALSAFGNKN